MRKAMMGGCTIHTAGTTFNLPIFCALLETIGIKFLHKIFSASTQASRVKEPRANLTRSSANASSGAIPLMIPGVKSPAGPCPKTNFGPPDVRFATKWSFFAANAMAEEA